MMNTAEICVGRVMHRRLRPADHQFSYGVFFLRLPLSSLTREQNPHPRALGNRWFSLNRFNLLSFHERDHGARDGSSLEDWARKLLMTHGVTHADGEIVLQTFPRLLGYVFNPISIWYCYDRQQVLRAAICEVANTFGEHHNYLVSHADGREIVASDWLTARKVFHVSPFCEVRGFYRFRFEQNAGRAFAQIDYFDGAADDDKLVITTIHGLPQPMTAAAAFSAFVRYPLMTVAVVTRIHWQAFKLWRKKVPFFAKPPLPDFETTRSLP
jgi:uncharacterized protein